MSGEPRTIFALASGAGRAAIAVLRLSGPACGPILDALCGRRPAPRHAALRTLRNATAEVLDRAMVLWLPGPGSYTGEDCAELQVHGGRAVIEGVSDALLALGARPAAPGEFTRRAFLNGRLDLLEAEGIADLIDAETTAQRRQALRQMDGALSRLYEGWTARLRHLLAWQEALIDFPDEDLPEETEAQVLAEIAPLRSEIAAHLADAHRGERLRDGLVCVLAGAPNVGKSSLLNALTGRDAAIVSTIPGTTRDAVESRVELGGVPVLLVDTAGIRPAQDEIEQEGVRRARAHAAAADLVIEVIDASAPAQALNGAAISLRVANKIDLAPAPPAMLGISAVTGAGIPLLRERLAGLAREMIPGDAAPALTRTRHRASLEDTLTCLDSAAGAAYPELRAEDLRQAVRRIGHIGGATDVEDILDRVFASFCIGK